MQELDKADYTLELLRLILLNWGDFQGDNETVVILRADVTMGLRRMQREGVCLTGLKRVMCEGESVFKLPGICNRVEFQALTNRLYEIINVLGTY